jgi:hypothetical protein
MKGELPADLRKPSARFWWELQHLAFPESLTSWSPMWASGPFLPDAEVLPGGGIRIGEAEVQALVVDCEYLEESTLSHVARLSGAGARIILTRLPGEPGQAARAAASGTQQRAAFSRLIRSLARGSRTRQAEDPANGLSDVPPLIQCEDSPDFTVREQGGDLMIFASHPAARGIRYPMEHGAWEKARRERRTGLLRGAAGLEVDLDLAFDPAGSILLQVGRRGGAGRVKAQFRSERASLLDS